LPTPAGLDGRSLRPQLVNAAAKTDKPALGFWTNGQRTIRDDRWRLIAHARATPGESPTTELFDLVADPDEAQNEAAHQPGVVADLLKRLPPPLATRNMTARP
jgi:arylsulfatase A-like enzyme